MLARANKFVMKLGDNEAGLNAIEYFLVAGLITMGAIVSSVSLDGALGSTFGMIERVLTRLS